MAEAGGSFPGDDVAGTSFVYEASQLIGPEPQISD